jgi:hypothetical protein
MAVVSDTRSVDIEDDIKRRRPPIHPPICICLILKPRGGGSSCTPVEEPACQWSLRALVEESARRWRSPRTDGSVSPVEEPTRRWSHVTGGGSRSSVEEHVRRWSPFTGGGAHTPVEELARWCLDGWLQEGTYGGGVEP